MPTSVLVAIGGYFAGEALAAAAYGAIAGEIGAWLTVSQYAVFEAASSFLVSTALRGALGGGAEQPLASPSFTATAEQRTHIIRSAVANRQIIYGRAKVSGPLVFAASSADNNTLHLVIALAGHEIDAVESVYLNDELSTDAKFSGYVTTAAHLGAADQVADADLVAAGLGWTTAHRLRGVAYLYVKLTYSRDVFPRGIPNISAKVRGKKLYDPRTGLTVWSQNLALAVRDYLAGSYGLSSSSAEIDDTALIAAANICDEDVNLADETSEARYTCNGVLDTGATPRANMESLLSGCGGALTWPAGRWTLHVGAYESPSVALNEDDLAGPLQVRARVPRQDLYNAIKGTFVDPTQGWQPTDFPAITNATYAAQDGAQIFRDVAFPVTTSSATAQRLAKMIVEKSRQGITVQASFKLGAFKLATWENMMLSIASMGWSNKVFKVTGWGFNEVGNINLTLQEEAAACYTWSAEETIVDPAPDTNLPAWNVVPAPGVPTVTESLYSTTGSAGVKARATMSWAPSTDAFVYAYLPEFKLASDSAWTVLPATSDTSASIDDLLPQIYHFRLRAENSFGVRSDYSGVCAKELYGLTVPPISPTGFSVIASNGLALGQWDLSQDLDVRLGGLVVARWTPLTTGAVWENGIDVGEFPGGATSGLLPMLTGTYLLKLKDSSGNWCSAAATVVFTAGNLVALPNSLTVTEHAAFTGTKTDVVVDAGALKLNGVSLIDSFSTLIDSWGYIDDMGGVATSGTYDFAALMDFGSVVTRRITPTIQALAFDTGDKIDSRGLVDEWDSIDGDVINDATAQLLAAISTDAVSYGGWFPLPAGDVTCRAIKYRLAMASGSPTHNISISQLSVTANW